jgi:signal transduction histidine kinase
MEMTSSPDRAPFHVFRDRRSAFRALALVVALSLYLAVFPSLFRTHGAAAAALSLVPVVFIGWWYGLRLALASGVAFLFVNTVLISMHGQISWASVLQQTGFGSAALIVSGGVIGRLHDVEQAARRELSERRRAEQSLSQHQALLEQTVAARTAELRAANEQLQRQIAEREQIEHELKAALAKEKELGHLKARFTSMVSHEFRTPLTVIQSSADILKRYGATLSDESKADKLERIQEQIDHMVGLLDDVLSISRADSIGPDYSPRLADLRDECRAIAREFGITGGSHHIDITTDDAPVLALVDPKLLRRALTNLISNAMKYSPRGSTVSVIVRSEEEHARIRVRDQGIGIPEVDRAGLFEMFHRATNVGRISGTGLGLPIARQAVEAHGGTISFDSVLHRGSEFTISLPLVTVDA